jgi:protein SCO1/2
MAVKKVLAAAAVAIPILIVAIIFSLARPRPEPLPVLWPVPEFSLLDQDSLPFNSAQMSGKVWLANFVYTNCPDFCPLVTQRMAVLRDSIARDDKLRERVRLLSITVDPLRDTPAVLREYAQTFRASKPSWLFLTGPVNQVIPLINEGFHLSTIHPKVHDPHEHTHAHDSIAGDYMVSHSDRIVLIDAQRRVRGTYASADPEALRRLWMDLPRVTN